MLLTDLGCPLWRVGAEFQVFPQAICGISKENESIPGN